jgi:hypothetical protein
MLLRLLACLLLLMLPVLSTSAGFTGNPELWTLSPRNIVHFDDVVDVSCIGSVNPQDRFYHAWVSREARILRAQTQAGPLFV